MFAVLVRVVAPPVAILFPYTTLFRSQRQRPDGFAHCAAEEVSSRQGRIDYDYDSNQLSSRSGQERWRIGDRKSTRLNSSHLGISYAVFCLKKKTLSTDGATAAAAATA